MTGIVFTVRANFVGKLMEVHLFRVMITVMFLRRHYVHADYVRRNVRGPSLYGLVIFMKFLYLLLQFNKFYFLDHKECAEEGAIEVDLVDPSFCGKKCLEVILYLLKSIELLTFKH